MVTRLLYVITALTLFISAGALANPPCPRTANSLEEFAVCMRPLPNGSGQVLVSSGSGGGGMDSHTRGLMNSLHTYYATPHISPAVAATSVLSNMAVAMGYAYRYRNHWGYYPYFPYYPSPSIGVWATVGP